jgi:hypothetical protein
MSKEEIIKKYDAELAKLKFDTEVKKKKALDVYGKKLTVCQNAFEIQKKQIEIQTKQAKNEMGWFFTIFFWKQITNTKCKSHW